VSTFHGSTSAEDVIPAIPTPRHAILARASSQELQIPFGSVHHKYAVTGFWTSKESLMNRDDRMRWWREARFGLFIHWGLYAVPAGEWNGQPVKSAGEWIMNTAAIPVADYEKLAPKFNPAKFDARQWVATAKNAGMKYIVITVQAPRWLCALRLKVGSYDVMDATPFKRDILAELSQACQDEGLRMCWYHSIMDWHHPDAQAPTIPSTTRTAEESQLQRYVDDYLKPQCKELLTNYGPIGVMWFDGEWIPDWTEEMGKGHGGLLPIDPAGGHRQQPRRQGASGHAGHEQVRRRRGRLRDARAGSAGQGLRPRRGLGNVHDDERHVGVQEGRHKVEIEPRSHSHGHRHRIEGREFSAQRRPDGGG
jgi:hypothetical protein